MEIPDQHPLFNRLIFDKTQSGVKYPNFEKDNFINQIRISNYIIKPKIAKEL